MHPLVCPATQPPVCAPRVPSPVLGPRPRPPEMVQLADRMRTFVARTQAAATSEGPLHPLPRSAPPQQMRGPRGCTPRSRRAHREPQPSTASAAATAAGFSSAEEMQDSAPVRGHLLPVTKESAGALFHQQLSRR